MKRIYRILGIILTVMIAMSAAGVAEKRKDESLIFDEDFFIEEHHRPGNLGKDNFYIKINLAENLVSVYQRIDGEWTELGTKKCTTGSMESPTPAGVFKVRKKELTFPKNDQNWNYVTYFYKDYAIHSTGEVDGKYDNQHLGRSTSHGCVRLKPEDAKWIYENIPIGTKIEIE